VEQGTDPTKTGNYFTNRTKLNLLFHETKTCPNSKPKTKNHRYESDYNFIKAVHQKEYRE